VALHREQQNGEVGGPFSNSTEFFCKRCNRGWLDKREVSNGSIAGGAICADAQLCDKEG